MAPSYVLLLCITCVVCQGSVEDLNGSLGNVGAPKAQVPPVATAVAWVGSQGWGRRFCDNPCKCGISRPSTRIVGGRLTVTNEYPWAVGLRQFGRVVCGGTLITDRHVLTSAWCLNMNVLVYRLITTVVIGENRRFFRAPLLSKKIQNVFRHEYYHPRIGGIRRLDHDIGLVLLADPIEFGPQLSPACLPSPGRDLAGQTATAVGWGRRGETDTSLIQELRAVDIPILDQASCSATVNYPKAPPNPRIRDGMLCAGTLDGLRGPCGFDTGGPLLAMEGNRTVVVGVMSWSEGCSRPHRPAVYTRVSAYRVWLRTFTKSGCFCA